jgi:DnaJ-class molecular chaperone
MTQPLTLAEAINGFSKTFKHLDGHAVQLKRTKVTQPNFTLKIEKEGMPQHEFPSETGDLYCTFTVIIPTKLTKVQKDSIAAILSNPAHTEL